MSEPKAPPKGRNGGPTARGEHDGRWSFTLARVAGVPIRVHVTFGLLLIWVAYSAASAGQSVLMQLGLVLGVFACILLHEFGHVLVAKRFGIGTRDVTLYPIGGVSSLKSMGEPRQELWITLAGPLTSVAIAAVLWGVLYATGRPFEAARFREWRAGYLEWLAVANVVLAAFNFVPAFPMDGGRILRAALALRIGKPRATRIAARVGQGFAIAMALAGLLLPNMLLVFVALFVFLGAQAEASSEAALESTRGKSVQDAMITEFLALSPDDTLETATDRLLRTHQEDFPVLDGTEVVGVLTRRRLIEALSAPPPRPTVGEAMDREVPTLARDAPLREALERLQRPGGGPLLVMEDGRLLGVVTRENVMEFLAVAQAAEGPRSNAPAPEGSAQG